MRLAAAMLALLAAGCMASPGLPPANPSATDAPISSEGPASSGGSSASGPAGPSSSSSATCGWTSSQPCSCPWVDGCAIPAADPDPEVAFLLEGSYPQGQQVDVKVRNVGDRAFTYLSHYAACELSYYTESGRRFLVPEGTHCDIVNRARLDPGEEAFLFVWDLDECVKDQWGCGPESEEVLPKGIYHVRGTFCLAVGEEYGGNQGSSCAAGNTTAGASLRIV